MPAPAELTITVPGIFIAVLSPADTVAINKLLILNFSFGLLIIVCNCDIVFAVPPMPAPPNLFASCWLTTHSLIVGAIALLNNGIESETDATRAFGILLCACN